MKQKVWSVSVLGNKPTHQRKNIDFYTTDTKAELVFEITDKEMSPTSATISIYNKNDKSLVSEDYPVKNKKVTFPMYTTDRNVIEHNGPWVAQVVFEQNGGKYTSRQVQFTVGGNVLDERTPALVAVENWTKFVNDAEELFAEWVALEETLESNENERIAKEQARQDNYQELLDTGVLQTNINTKLEQLEEVYAPKLTEVTSQLAQKANRDDVFSMANMGQDVKEAMTGGSVAVVGKNTILEENIVDKQVSSKKTTFAKKGKNLLDGKYENLAVVGDLTVSYQVAQTSNGRSIIAKVLPNTTYTITKYDTSNRFTIATFDHEPVIYSDTLRAFPRNEANSFTLTTNETDAYIMIYTSTEGGEPRAQLELGSESTNYEDYNAVSIDLSDETLNSISESLSYKNRKMVKLTELRDYTPSNNWLDEQTLWKDTSKMYAFYDNLLATSNGYGEKTIWFNDNQTNEPVYLYKFIPPKPQNTDIKYPKILITSVHAFEYLASTVVARWISDVVNNWETNPNLEIFRWNVEIHIAPITNTHGHINGIRTNENDVDLNRNFGTSGWEETGEGTDYYTGPTPNSEKQTQKVIELVENGNYDFVIDAHGYNTLASDGNALWVGYTEPSFLPRLSSWANKVNADLKSNYGGDVTKSNDHLILTRKGSNPGRFLAWLDENGHDGAVFEMVHSIGTTREDLQSFLVKSFGEMLNTVINHVSDL